MKISTFPALCVVYLLNLAENDSYWYKIRQFPELIPTVLKTQGLLMAQTIILMKQIKEMV